MVTICFIPSLLWASEVILKSGQKIEGKIIEQTNKFVKIDSGIGVATTYYNDEIETVDGQKLNNEQGQNAKELFERAVEKSQNMGENFPHDIIDNGWNPKGENLVNQSKAAVNLFKQAIEKRIPGESLLLDKPKKPTAKDAYPQFFAGILLYQLLLVDIESARSKGDIKTVEQDTIDAVAFIRSLADPDFQIMLSTTLECMAVDLLSPSLQRTFNDKGVKDKDFCEKLSKSFKKLLDSQPFLKRGYDEDSVITLNSMDIEPGTYNKAYLPAARERYEEKYAEFAPIIKEAIQLNEPDIFETRFAEFKQKSMSDTDSCDHPRTGDVSTGWADCMLTIELSNIRLPITIFYYMYDRIKLLYLSSIIKQFEIDKGGFPSNLSTLIGGYIDNLPQDDFSKGNDFVYKKSDHGFLLYGLGPSKKDSQGTYCLTGFDYEKSLSGGNICLTIGE